MTRTISLLNMKGGVGKTTLAVNLASYMYTHVKKRVLLIDLDPQFNASQYLMDFKDYETHLRDNGTIADILIEQPNLGLKQAKKPKTDKSRIVRLNQGNGGCFDFLPSQLELAHVVKNPAQMDFRLEKILSNLRSDYDYIFIDCAPTDSVLTTMALTASNFLLIPVRPDRFSILGYANLMKTIAAFKNNAHDPNGVRELGLVFTQVNGGSTLEAQCIADIEQVAGSLGSYVFPSRFPFSQTILRSIEEQTPIYETRFAREELKTSTANIVSEMEARIATLERVSP